MGWNLPLNPFFSDSQYDLRKFNKETLKKNSNKNWKKDKMDRKWQLASLRPLPKFSHRPAPRTLCCSWQMRELSHLLTSEGARERPGRWGGRAVSTFLSRRWIAHAVAIYHSKESRGGLTGCSVTLLPSEAQVEAWNANGAPSILQPTDADPQ